MCVLGLDTCCISMKKTAGSNLGVHGEFSLYTPLLGLDVGLAMQADNVADIPASFYLNLVLHSILFLPGE